MELQVLADPVGSVQLRAEAPPERVPVAGLGASSVLDDKGGQQVVQVTPQGDKAVREALPCLVLTLFSQRVMGLVMMRS